MFNIKNIHFVGIGGSGMSGIAEVLINQDYHVTGSDLKASETTARLEELGAQISIGHDPRHVQSAQVVVYSSAVKSDNPELIAAKYRNIPIIPRAEMLAELMRMKYGIAIAGAHGKTTVTSMLAHILAETDLDPTVVIGGRLNMYNANARLGRGKLMLAEADESDGSFMRLSPTIAVVTNVDEEHLDHYKGGMAEITETFQAFMNKVPFYGLVVACSDDERLAAMLPNVTRRVVTFGLQGNCDIAAANIRAERFSMRYDLLVRGKAMGEVELAVPGRHNVLNSLAAISVGLEFNVPMDAICRALKEFTGADRRFHQLGVARDRRFVDDYAHHPTEIKVTIQAAREAFDKRIVAVFQPHRFTRLRDCWDRFLNSFDGADQVIVVPVYTAGETPIADIDGATFAAALTEKHPAVSYVDKMENLSQSLLSQTEAGDLILHLGAGSISQHSKDIFAAWQAAGDGA